MSLKVNSINCIIDNKKILHDISFELQSSQIHVVIGPNGAGKSTLLQSICGLLPYSGSVYLQHDLIEVNRFKQNAKLISLMSQFQSTPPLLVKDLLSLGRRVFSGFSLQSSDQKIINEIVGELGIQKFLERSLDSLSGGERQMVYLAKALIQTPKVLLLDEPISHLDPKNQMDILNTIKKVTLQKNLITIVVIHDLQNALHYSDSVLMLKEGKLLHNVATKDLNETMLAQLYDIKCKIFKNEGHPFVLLGHKHIERPSTSHQH